MDVSAAEADMWRLMLQHSPIGMTVVALDGRLLMVNRALSEMLGHSQEELRRRGFQELTHPDDLDADLALFEQALAGEIESYRIRKRYLHADGHVIWGDLSVALVRDAEGQPLHFISQILDITEQRHAEERLEAIFESVNVGLLLIGPDGSYERMNRQHRETLMIPFPDGHEGTAGQLGLVYHLDGKTLMTREEMPSYRAAQGEEFDDYTYWVGDDPATRRAYSTSARQIRGPEGERLGSALSYQNITDLVRAMKLKDEFVSSVSHELRTPLTSVLGYLEVLRDRDDLPAEVVGQLRVIQRNAHRLQMLLSDLLQVGQAAELGNVLQLADVDLAALLREAATAVQPGAESLDIDLALEAPRRLTTSADPDRIRQVLDNLLSNAVKYTPQGGRVTARLWAEDDLHVLEVSDTGIGIAPDEVGQVFDRFFRGRSALEQQIPGTGLGLDIVHAIVSAHGGEISVDSEVGKGSTFRVALPIEHAEG